MFLLCGATIVAAYDMMTMKFNLLLIKLLSQILITIFFYQVLITIFYNVIILYFKIIKCIGHDTFFFLNHIVGDISCIVAQYYLTT